MAAQNMGEKPMNQTTNNYSSRGSNMSPNRGIAGLKALSNLPNHMYQESKDELMMPGPSQMSVQK